MDFFIALLFIAGFEASVAAICPLGWHRYADACYFVIKEEKEWKDANEICDTIHANLAVPNTHAEQTFVWELLLQEFNQIPIGGAWTGCNYIQREDQWQNCPLRGNRKNAYQNWQDGKPDYTIPGTDCALMEDWNGGQWANQYCTNPRFSTCERLIIDYKPPLSICLQTGSDGHIASRCLTGHLMKELPAQGLLSCSKACLSDPPCNSFNLLDQGQGKTMCQLNNMAIQNAAVKDVKEIENCYGVNL